MILGFVVMALLQSNESAKEFVLDIIHAMSSPLGVIGVSVVLLPVSAVLWRFSRSRLILD
jgi:hypothetical protein